MYSQTDATSVCEITFVLYLSTKSQHLLWICWISVQTKERERAKEKVRLRMQQDSWNRLEWFPRTERENKVQQCAAAMGGSQWKHQETVCFPPASSTDVIGEHFQSPWLQETGQGCLFFFWGFKAWGAGPGWTPDNAVSDWLFVRLADKASL